MKLLDAVTGATTQTGRTNKAIDTLSFKFVSTADAGLTSWATMTLEVIRNTGNSQQDQTKINDLNLRNLAEFFAMSGEGYIKKTYATLGGSSKLSIVECEIPLSAFGIEMGKDEEIQFAVKGLTSTDTVTAYGLENCLAGPGMYQFNKVDIINDREKHIDISTVEALFIPQSGLDHILVTYRNGKTIKLLPEELNARARMNNDMTSFKSDDGTISSAGSENIYALDVVDATELYIKTTADSYVVLIDLRK